MPKHTKNLAASAFFSHDEKKRLNKDYGTLKERLGTDSLKPIECCCLCIQNAKEPVICPSGHLFCKECIYASLLQQKKDIAAAQKKWDDEQRKREREAHEQRIAEKQADIQKFANTELGVVAERAQAFEGKKETLAPAERDAKLKRKFQDEFEKREVAAFWVNSNQPTATISTAPPPSCTQCPEGKHDLKLKQLCDVQFKIEKGDTVVSDEYQCYICQKTLRNGLKVAVLSTCGHAMCMNCVDGVADKQCLVCQKAFEKTDVVTLQNGGTAFAGSGAALIATKVTPGFQC